MNHALIMMGGCGTRFGASIPKQFIEVNKKPVFAYLLSAYQEFDLVDSLYIVCHPDWIGYTEEWVRRLNILKVDQIVAGGNCRSQSVQFGLRAMSANLSRDDIVLIHDVTHPFLDKAKISDCIDYAKKIGASTLASSCLDTVYSVDDEDVIKKVENRDYLVSATAPECFQFGRVYDIYKEKDEEELSKMTSAGAMLVAAGEKIKVIRTPLINLKVTYADDMEAFKKLIHGYYYE